MGWSPGSAFALLEPPDTTHLWAYAESMGGPQKTDDELLCQGHSAGSDFPALEADLVHEALAAIERRHWERLKLLLHPYLHWTTKDGETLRGRKRVMARLVEAASPLLLPPANSGIGRFTAGRRDQLEPKDRTRQMNPSRLALAECPQWSPPTRWSASASRAPVSRC
jgi:hypothetical protein